MPATSHVENGSTQVRRARETYRPDNIPTVMVSFDPRTGEMKISRPRRPPPLRPRVIYDRPKIKSSVIDKVEELEIRMRPKGRLNKRLLRKGFDSGERNARRPRDLQRRLGRRMKAKLN